MITVDAGTDEVEKMLLEAEVMLGVDAVDKVLGKATLDAVAESKENAPVDTGAHKASIYWDHPGKASYRIIAPMDYAAYIELGTSKKAAQPHMIPAADRAINAASEAMARAIDKAGGSSGSGDTVTSGNDAGATEGSGTG
jgi:HK97 gp10 family phage protein